jgi:uncharacterized protein involved in response to NO
MVAVAQTVRAMLDGTTDIAQSEALRLLIWQPFGFPRTGPLVMLHLGFARLPIGLILIDLTRVSDTVLSKGDTMHGLTAGAVACSIHAVATRPLARRIAYALRASSIGALGFAAV